MRPNKLTPSQSVKISSFGKPIQLHLCLVILYIFCEIEACSKKILGFLNLDRAKYVLAVYGFIGRLEYFI